MTEAVNILYSSKSYVLTSNADTDINTSPTAIVPSDHVEFDKENESYTFIIVPLCALCVVILLTGLVFLFLRKKRLDRLRHYLMPLYNFDPREEGEDWEAELLEENDDKFERKGYKSIGSTQTENAQVSLQ